MQSSVALRASFEYLLEDCWIRPCSQSQGPLTTRRRKGVGKRAATERPRKPATSLYGAPRASDGVFDLLPGCRISISGLKGA